MASTKAFTNEKQNRSQAIDPRDRITEQLASARTEEVRGINDSETFQIVEELVYEKKLAYLDQDL